MGNVENFHLIWAIKYEAEEMPRVDLPLVHLHSDNKGRSSLKQLFKGGGKKKKKGQFSSKTSIDWV